MSSVSLLSTSDRVGRPSLAPILLSLAAATDVPSFKQSSSEYPMDHPLMKPPIKASPARRNTVRHSIVQYSEGQHSAVYVFVVSVI